MRKGLLQLVEFRSRSVHFQPDQIGDLQCFREQRADVLQMREKPLRIRIAFATENFITVESELIKKILLFLRRYFDERQESRLERLQLSRINFEIRMQSDEIRKRLHPRILHRSAERVELFGVRESYCN